MMLLYLQPRGVLLEKDVSAQGGELQEPLGAGVAPPGAAGSVGFIQPMQVAGHELGTGTGTWEGGGGGGVLL